jgi:hypothetical protein
MLQKESLKVVRKKKERKKNQQIWRIEAPSPHRLGGH